MSEKQKIIREMLDMQKKFIEYEHAHGVHPKDYFHPPPGHELDDFRRRYDELARKLVDLAHAEKGSTR